jgi:predicted Rdx family selenoprotein
MSVLLSIKGSRYLRAEAELMATELQSTNSEWTYTVASAPGNCGLFCIEVRERDGSLIGRFGQ